VAGAFKLLVLIHDGDTKSYLARHPSFDRTVMLHVLPQPGSTACDELIALMERLSPAAQKMILDRGEENGAGYLVTDKIADFRSLRDWLEKAAVAPLVAPVPAEPAAPEAPPVEAPAPAPAPAPGEFTRLFQAVPATSAAPDPPPPPAAQPAAPQPGEFTRLFTGAQSSTATPVSGAGVEPAAAAPQPKPPGAFTKAFRALSEGVPPVPQPAESAPEPPRPSRPGEFTSLFQAPLPPAPEQQDLGRRVSRPQDAPARPAFQQAGEFTRMFGVADKPPAPAPVEPPRAPAQPEAPKPASSADPYESMFSVPPVSPENEPTAIVAPPPKSALSSNLPIIIILAALLLLALGLIAYFALKR